MKTESMNENDRASSLAYQLASLIDVCLFAHENENTAVPHDRRGIEQTLKMASEMFGQLIDLVEHLEAGRCKAQEGKH